MHVIPIVLAFLMIPVMSHASPCSEFPWLHPAEIVEPPTFQHAQQAMKNGQLSESRELFTMFLKENPEGALANSGRWALATLPAEGEARDSDRDTKIVNIINRLTAERRNDPKSPYAPWALCRVGELYRELGWKTEASGAYEEFLDSYPDHRLAGGVLLNAGYGFIQKGEYIEAALIFRRLIREPKWEQYHVKGALGLADATAFSQAWPQASYWYQAVEAENPRLIRDFAWSSYNYGLSESQLGRPFHGVDWFLATYNLHPEKVEAGYALNKIGSFLLEKQHDIAALWFFDEASRKYKSKEPGRRAELHIVRWIVKYLSSDHSKTEWDALYTQFNNLEIFQSVSWDNVIELTRKLAQSPEVEIADEAQFWLAEAYQNSGDTKGALEGYRQLVEFAGEEHWRHKAQVILTDMLSTTLRALYARQAWVKLIETHQAEKKIISLLPTNPEWMRMLADAYRFVGLPRQALTHYQELLQQNIDPAEQEQILTWNVELANDIAEGDVIRQAADAYIQTYPRGQQRAGIALILGQLDMRDEKAQSAVKQFTYVIKHGRDKNMQQQGRVERARAYQRLGQIDSAIADYRQLMNRNAASVGTQLSLADLLYQQKRFPEAVKVYEPITQSDSKKEAKAWAQFRLALCYQGIGKRKKAESLLKDLRQPDQDVKDLEMTIQSAAAAVIDEFVPAETASS